MSSTKLGPRLSATRVVRASKKFRAMKTDRSTNSLLSTLERSNDMRNFVSLTLASAYLSFILFLSLSSKFPLAVKIRGDKRI